MSIMYNVFYTRVIFIKKKKFDPKFSVNSFCCTQFCDRGYKVDTRSRFILEFPENLVRGN